MSTWHIVLIVLAVLAALYAVSRGAHYRKMFGTEHFREIHSRFLDALRAAKKNQDSHKPSLENGSAFVTSARVAIAVTYNEIEEAGEQKYVCHVSISHAPMTTHAGSSRMGFFIIGIFSANKVTLTPFFTQSGVRHLVLSSSEPLEKLLGFDECYRHYQQNYQHIPFQFEKVA